MSSRTLDAASSTAPSTTGAMFRDASAEWLRYVEHDRKRRPSTARRLPWSRRAPDSTASSVTSAA